MKIAVVDGQGGGIGKHITEKIRQNFLNDVKVIALGTNSLATNAMMKSGANEGATGENAIVQTVKNVDIIVGTVSIIVANSMLGELTPKMAVAVGSANAKKLLLPINKSNIEVIGVNSEPLPHLIDYLIDELKKYMEVDLYV